MSTWTDIPAPRRLGAPDLRRDENAVRLLLVEDSSICVELLLASLDRAHRGRFEVECTGFMPDAEWLLGDGGFDAVVVDLTVPGYGAAGVDAVCEIAQRVPVVALTGTQDRALEARDAEARADEGALGRIGRSDLPGMILRAVHRHRRVGVCGAEPIICRIPAR